jgi:hydrophobe/amphiphile efflux-1 (HAE1) family protein
MARFFIDRPVLAMVIAIVITMLGLIALPTLPIAQYPSVVPPQVQITCTYRGANAQDVEKTVAVPIEQQLVAIDDLIYIISSSANDGTLSMTLTFEVGTDVDLAVVKVQNKVNLALPVLPDDVRREGVVTQKVASGFLMAISLTSPEGRYDDLFLANYAAINLIDRLGSLPGVGQARLGASRLYGMRIWVDPDKMAKLGLTVSDIQDAINAQNRQNPAGSIGRPPNSTGVDMQYPVNAGGRLENASEFEDIILRANEDRSIVRIKDVGRAELGAVDYSSYSRLNGGPAAAIIISLAPEANALSTADACKKLLNEASKSFPAGIEYLIPFDSTRFVTQSVEEVIQTFAEALLLVILVVFVFLQDWRATLIPLLTVPVSIIGTFALFPFLGFSVNTISLFGMVLAIGIVVDDAIVVVEAVQHNIDEEGMTSKEATIRAMEEVSGPVVAIAFILAAVFVPVAFLGGITGQIYRQFALTIAVSVLLSAVSALTLSPALSSLLLRPSRTGGRGPLARFFHAFNRGFEWTTNKYLIGVKSLIRRMVFALVPLLLIYAGLLGLFKILPTGFLPDEDQGYFFVTARLPDGASLERTQAVMKQVEAIAKKTPGIKYFITFGGFDLINGVNNPNVGTLIVTLDPWDERKTPNLQLKAVLGRLARELASIDGALAFAFGPPPIIGLSSSGGFEFMVQDRTGRELGDLFSAVDATVAGARQRPELSSVSSNFRVSVPQLSVKLDRDKAQTIGVPITDVYATLQAFLGASYVNDFNQFGRTWKVMLQAEPQFRQAPEDIQKFYVRAGDRTMIPLSTLVSVTPTSGPEVVYRYNRYRAAKITGAAAGNFTSGEANAAMEQTAAKTLPQGFGYEWTGTVFQQKRSEGKEPITFGLSTILVLLLLAALYESWSTPFAVVFAVPLGIFGALCGLWLSGHAYDVYTQIGIVALIGLAAKNAILIVEFAKLRQEEGMTPEQAATEAAHLRLRPILMTSFAFILGVVPLARATGAGSGARNALGVSVFSGMLSATMLAIFIVPVLYVLVQRIVRRRTRVAAEPTPASVGD